MSRLAQDWTADPVSRDQILRRERGQGNINVPCSAGATCRIGNLTRLIYTLATCVTIHTWCDRIQMLGYSVSAANLVLFGSREAKRD